MLDPALPSTPPPPPPDAVKPMSLAAASGWVIAIHLGFMCLAVVLVSLREEMLHDVVSHIFCQLIIYGLGLFLLLRGYAENSRIRDFVGVRKSHWLLYPLALIVGGSATVPASALLGLIEARWPLDEGPLGFTKLFFGSTPVQQGMIALGVVILAPVVEEALFRGAIFVPLRKRYGAWTVILATGVLFAIVHQVPQRLVPLFLMGALVGYLRSASGTLVASVLAHAAFNAVPMAQMFALGPIAAEQDDLPNSWLIGISLLCVLAIAAFQLVAQSSRDAAAARREDL